MEELHHQEVAFSLFRESNDAFFIFDPADHCIVDVNPAARRLTGLDKKALCARRVSEVFDSPDAGGIERLIDAYRVTGFFHSREGYSLRRHEREPIPVNVSVSRIHIQPHPLGLVVARDVSERKRAEEALSESERRYRLLFECNPHPMWVVDAETGSFLDSNLAAIRCYGYSREELAAMTLDEIVVDVEPGEARHRRKDGTIIDVEIVSHPLQLRGRSARLFLATDVTERRRAERQLVYQARHDPLTGLLNRAAFHDRLGLLADSARGSGAPLALLVIDLDGFKAVNDNLGHHGGDLVLRDVARRFRGGLREPVDLGRLGGDEFAALLPGCDTSGAVPAAARLLEALREPFRIEGREAAVGASIGIATFPVHGDDPDRLLRRADAAMYAAKRSGGGFACAEPPRDGPPTPAERPAVGPGLAGLAGPAPAPRGGAAAGRWPLDTPDLALEDCGRSATGIDIL
ncbi:MAG TPA: sensor domain-containing diguanylate cyclase [Isosphaeraceae bacterium]|jgi:diguanylate cyclase (GGDEF)-like protein/PAS domain S-box-containing protein|nr:sensor domain-containing diguanylate cyclase [Isosphaeraceae bacterium]